MARDGYAFGIDVGGTSVKIGMFDQDGVLMVSWEIPTRKEARGSHILPDVAGEIASKMQEIGLTAWEVSGIGVGVPGPVLDRRIVNRCSNLGWGRFDVRKTLQELTGVTRIVVENDANVAALGEFWKGGGRTARNVAMITLGTGIGAGFIQDGRIVSGSFGAAGELGHLQINPWETVPCACGKCGHLQQYASASGMIRVMRERLQDPSCISSLRDVPLSAKEIIDAAKAGDAAALETVDTAAEMIGRTMSFISVTLDPELYLIGGGIAKAGDFLLDKIRHSFREAAFFASEGCEILPARLGNDAGVYGAVKMVLDVESDAGQ